MSMENDALKRLAQKAGSISDDESPYKVKKEGSRPVQVRDSLYKEIKMLAFQNDTKMIDLMDSMLRYALKHGDFDKK
ncbi:hypothetical protein [Apilactobacillus xinyiensis]|uniref:hypothetical protein n=1 Tax=Apilactobacillus xinyiensis TaxID=2841032 RepID=UPI0020106F6C|nr:hypothetical protein [Apilactobacillus xinyiensis]MCL0330555.1 hypothetical protein [Apilactobacillus xinyiensis]